MSSPESGKYLLDTNIVIAIFSQEQKVLEKLEENEIFIPSIVLGELFYGAYKSKKVEENLSRLKDLINASPVLSPDSLTAQYYGQIQTKLKVKGTPIPQNDIWIAATALQYQIILATRDDHFQEVDGLHTGKW